MRRIFNNKKFRIASWAIVVVSVIFVGIFMQSCNNEEFIDYEEVNFIDNSKLEIADFRNWLELQKITNEFIGTRKLNWDNIELKSLQDEYTSLLVSLEIYKGKNSLGNDSIIELHVANVKNNFIGGVKVFSFYDKENAHANYYNLNGQILEEGEYYAPKQLYSLRKRYIVGGGIIRLKSGNNESNDYCGGCETVSGSETPLYNANGSYNPAAYNCHSYIWGAPQQNNPYYNAAIPLWNDYPVPNIAISGYIRINGAPQVGDRWVSYIYASGVGNIPWHSATITEVTNGQVTKVRAKCGDGPIQTYNPSHSFYSIYMTNDVRYYRK
jgi:hypothetical protein